MKKAIKQSTLIFMINVVSVVLLVIIAGMIIVIAGISKDVHKASEDRFDLTYNANRFMNGSSYLTNEVRAYSATANEERYDNYWNEINNLKNRDIGVENMKKIGITSEEQKMIDEMSSLSNDLVPLEESAMNSVKEGDLQAALDYVYGDEYGDSIAKINEIKSSFLEELDNRMADKVQELNNRLTVMQVIAIIFAIGVIVIQIFSFIVLRRKVIRPISVVEKGMSKIAEGNLNVELEVEEDTSEIGMLVYAIKRTNECIKSYISDISAHLSSIAQGDMTKPVDLEYIGDFGPIKSSMEEILRSMNEVMGQINSSSAQVYAGAEKVSSGAQALSQGSTEQSSVIMELARSIEEITKEIKETAAYAQEANEKTEHAGEELARSNASMQDMTEAMSRINSTSSQIGKIIKTIEDIAFQTNILALNAAVEAARAGEAGKGFAVVADEVRSLAGKSAEAAGTTTELIQECVRAIEDGTQIANVTAESLLGVVDGANAVAEIVKRIMSAAGEQAEKMEQTSVGVNHISDVIQSNSATAEESAAASEELNQQSVMLEDMVKRFKLRG